LQSVNQKEGKGEEEKAASYWGWASSTEFERLGGKGKFLGWGRGIRK